MDRSDVVKLYDEQYAQEYPERFLVGPWARVGSEFEASVLRDLVHDDSRWLDVGCGTGYFLSLFPGVERAGLDLSPAMLALAREANPDAEFIREGDFRDDVVEWHHAWSVVSCMWVAYSYVESMGQVEQVIGNLARWTSAGGACFVPIIDLEDLRYVELEYESTPDVHLGTIALTGVTWTWDEPETGKRHEHLVAPHADHVARLLEPHFTRVEVLRYPKFLPGGISRKAVLATGRRPPGETGQAEVIWHPRPLHPDEVVEEAPALVDEPTDEVVEDDPPTLPIDEPVGETETHVDVIDAETDTGQADVPVHHDPQIGADGVLSLSSTSTARLAGEVLARINPFQRGFWRRLRRRLPGGSPGV